jgi:hypothetical protein
MRVELMMTRSICPAILFVVVALGIQSCRVGETLMASRPNELVPDFRHSTALTREVTFASQNRASRSESIQSNTCDIASVACGYTWVSDYGSQWQTEGGTYWQQTGHPWGASTLVGFSKRYVWYIGIKTPAEFRG